MATANAVRLNITVPSNRDFTGQIQIEDLHGVIAGPFAVCARCADDIASNHGNPSRAPTLPYGDPPTGEFRVKQIAKSGPGSRYRADLYGRFGAIVLMPEAGDAALADANGRFEILIHGGALASDGRLRATSGHFRVSDANLAELIDAVSKSRSAVQVVCTEELQRTARMTIADLDRSDDDDDSDAPVPQSIIRPAVASRNLVAFGEYSPGDLTPIGENEAAAVGFNAESVANDYATRGVTYATGGDASEGSGTSDCSHFVNDVLTRAGLDIPYTTTHDMATSEHFDEVPAAEARAGDVIVQGGHMGVYSGENDANGHPIGTQMGNHGVSEAPWGPGGWFRDGGDLKFYRPKQ